MERQFRAHQLQLSRSNRVFHTGMREQIEVERNLHQLRAIPMKRLFISDTSIWNTDYGSPLPYKYYNNNFPQPSWREPSWNNFPQPSWREPSWNNFPQPSWREPAWRGRVVSMALDCLDSQYLQAVIEEGDPREVAMILSEVRDHLHELMEDQFGNYLIQKLFEAKNSITDVQIHSIVYLVIHDIDKFLQVCKNHHGTRVVQIMMRNIECPFTKEAVLFMLKPIIVELMQNVNGGYVIAQCVKVFPLTLKKVILDELAKHCVDIATHKIGCSVIQTCLQESGILAIDLIKEIISNAMLLAQDKYGNYVVQFVINMGLPLVSKRVIAELSGNFARLSMNKHASNVVENLLICSNPDDVDAIVEELIRSSDLLNVLLDRYGNYVAQRALECTEGYLRRILSVVIRTFRWELKNHPRGKKVLEKAEYRE